MFSGIIENIAKVVAINRNGSNVTFTMECAFAGELHIDQSVAHNGVCLTVESIDGNQYTVTAIDETLQRSNLGAIKVGHEVNLERSMRPDSLLDGHIVQGHVDTTATCTAITEAGGSYIFSFEYTPQTTQGYVTVEKGSVTVNGVSLTVCNSAVNSFDVAIIPYTYNHTNFHGFCVGSKVNIEFDIIGKYIARLIAK